MSRSITVPDEIYEKAVKMAAERHVPVDDLIATALADQMSAQEYITRRAARSSRETFLAALDQVPDSEPQDHDDA